MFLDVIRMSVKNLTRKKSRSLLTVMGIAIGVASVVIIASIGDIGAYIIQQELSSLGVSGVMVSSNRKVAGSTLAEKQLEVIRESGSVDSAIPIIVDYTKIYMRELMLDTVIWGIDYGANQVISLSALHGRLITKNDVRQNRRVCVIDQNIAQAFYKRDNIVGKTLSMQFSSGMVEFEIVGVVSSGGNLMQGLMGSVIPSFVYLPYTTMQELSGRENFDQIAVRVKPGVDPDIAGGQIVSVLGREQGVTGAYKADNMSKQMDKINRVIDTITIVLSLIAGVSLIVAGLSIMTTMLVCVGERTREIGIKKSIGARKQNILFEFLVETFSISLFGSISGTLIGLIIVVAGCWPFGLPVKINTELVLFCIVFSVSTGVVFGVYPASVAAKLRPVDALRHE